MIQIALLAAQLALAEAPKAGAPKTAAAPAAAAAAAPIDPAPDKAAFNVAGDGKGHFFAWTFEGKNGEGLVAAGEGIPKSASWSADGKAFYEMQSYGGGAEGNKSFSLYLLDPRVRGHVTFELKDEKYWTMCGDKRVDFQRLTGDAAKKTLDGATFYQSRWTRRSYALARDEKGSYYYVDQLREDLQRDHGRDFRLFMGPRGQMKQQKMTNLVSDTEGDIFGTKNGDFRLVLNKKENVRESKWVAGGKETHLTAVPTQDNAALIYNDLGVYEGMKLGTPCDEF